LNQVVIATDFENLNLIVLGIVSYIVKSLSLTFSCGLARKCGDLSFIYVA